MLETAKELTYTNRVTSCGLHPSTKTHQFWMGCAQNLENMRVFGSRFWYVLPGSKVKRLDPIELEAMMIRYSFASKAYKLWDAELKKSDCVSLCEIRRSNC